MDTGHGCASKSPATGRAIRSTSSDGFDLDLDHAALGGAPSCFLRRSASQAGSRNLYFLGLAVVLVGGSLFALDDHAVPPPVHTPPEQLPFPFIRSAEASVVQIDRQKTARAIDANPAINHFMNIASELGSEPAGYTLR
jgi:hypothetical protein